MVNKNLKTQETIDYFKNLNVDKQALRYLSSQLPRYRFLIKVLDRVIENFENFNKKILLISPSFELEILEMIFPELNYSSLGYRNIRINPGEVEHLNFNLNSCDNEDVPDEFKNSEIIIMTEVIEHLEINVEEILRFIYGLLNHKGKLIIQTPNSRSLRHRLKKVEYERHISEYSIDALKNIGEKVGFKLERCWFKNYYSYQSMRNRVYNLLSIILPARLKEGITVIFRK